jgi:dTDP-4-dehydrorhamnose 3,5-epimerase
MLFTETKLKGAYLIELETFEDERGYFARSWSQRAFEEQGLDARLAECNISFNKREGTLRGMHYQDEPHGQAKLVRCTRGAIFDVIVDLRPDSETFRQWVGFDLSPDNKRMLYVPEKFAHGFQTLADNSEVFYQMSTAYAPESARGVRWDDPVFNIEWPPTKERIIIARDREYPDFTL